MFDFVSKLLRKKEIQKPSIEHDQFGHMEFDQNSKSWETTKYKIYLNIPGNIDQPFTESVDFINTKIQEIDKYWKISEDDLLEIAHNWDSMDKAISVKDLFKVSSISINSLDSHEWEICFETQKGNKWIYIGLHFEKDEIVANDITT